MPYKDNKEARRAYQRYYRSKKQKSHPLYYAWLAAKRRAKKTGLVFVLPLDSLVLPETCPVLGIELQSNEGSPRSNSYSMDRLDNTKGYTLDNVRVISHRANTMKSNMSIEQVEKLLEYMKGLT